MKKAAAEDVNVTFEDQQKINKFARNTSRITELKEEIEVKKEPHGNFGTKKHNTCNKNLSG